MGANIRMPMRARVAILVALLAVAMAGCAGGGGAGAGPATVTLYVSAPLRGEDAPLGRAIVRGSRVALAEAGGEAGGVQVAAVYLDETTDTGRRARWDPVGVALNARRASRDASAIVYVDGFEPASLRTSSPIVGAAMMLHVVPGGGAGARGGEPGFARRYGRRHGGRPGRWAAYGYEASVAVLDAIADAPDPTDRAAVSGAFAPSPGGTARRAEPLPRP